MKKKNLRDILLEIGPDLPFLAEANMYNQARLENGIEFTEVYGYQDAANRLSNLFNWYESFEGVAYWSDIHSKLTTKGLDEPGPSIPLVEDTDITEITTETKKSRDKPADVVNHPPHYTDGGIETIDFIEAKKLNYHLGNAVKYISRAGKKDDTKQDIEKAIWYLSRYLKNLKA